MLARRAELCVHAYRAPAGCKTADAPAFGVTHKHESTGVPPGSAAMCARAASPSGTARGSVFDLGRLMASSPLREVTTPSAHSSTSNGPPQELRCSRGPRQQWLRALRSCTRRRLRQHSCFVPSGRMTGSRSGEDRRAVCRQTTAQVTAQRQIGPSCLRPHVRACGSETCTARRDQRNH